VRIIRLVSYYYPSERAEKRRIELEKEIAATRSEKKFLEQLNRSLIEDQKAWRKRFEEAAVVTKEKQQQIDQLKVVLEPFCTSIR